MTKKQHKVQQRNAIPLPSLPRNYDPDEDFRPGWLYRWYVFCGGAFNAIGPQVSFKKSMAGSLAGKKWREVRHARARQRSKIGFGAARQSRKGGDTLCDT